MTTLLTELVRKQSAYAVIGLFNRTIDKVAEEIAHDILLDPELRANLQQLVRAAIQQAVKELHEPAPPADEVLRQRYPQLDRIETRIDTMLRENEEARRREKKTSPPEA